MIDSMIHDLERLDRSLCAYLDSKRAKFSRLFFTSNEELIDLMGHLKDQDYLQRFVSKLFEGVDGLNFKGEASISAYSSKTGEKINLVDLIRTETPPEVWLKQFELGMKRSMYEDLTKAVLDYVNTAPDDLMEWVKRWPG